MMRKTPVLAALMALILAVALSGCGVGAKYTVTYDGNGSDGGVVPIDSTQYAAGQTVVVLGNPGSLTKTGYAYTGWNTETDGTGTTYTPGQTFTMESADVVLYAKWSTGSTFTVTYHDNGSTEGSVPADAAHYELAQTVTVLGNTGGLVKTGCTFVGWNTEEDGSGTDYPPGATFMMGLANVDLYAKWITDSTSTIEFIMNANTIALWHFNEDSGITVADSASNYPLSLMDGGTGDYPTFENGKNGFNNCLSFSGVNQWLQTSHTNAVDYPASGITVEFWINYSTLPNGVNVYDILQAVDLNCFNLFLDSSGKINWYLYSGTGWTIVTSTSPVPNDSAWHYVACTWDGTQSCVYIDGAFTSSNPGGFSPGTPILNGLYMAGIGGASCLDGKLDEMRILSVARSDAEIQNYYSQAK